MTRTLDGTPAPVVKTASGTVRGGIDGTAAVFKGVPFAAPPFGAGRLRAPLPPEPWDGVRDAVAFGPRPPQSGAVFGMPSWTADEGLDCLTVNVWTPDPGGSGLPVMVWLHGGAYMAGFSGQADYDGALLAGAGVVVVTFNYRVGFEGFGTLAGAPANRGLLDQVAALRWVRDNIAAFGGDPDAVTVFGESAGAGSIASLLAMPSARGLFRRAVAQSVPGTFFSAGLAARLGAGIAGELGRAATLDDLEGTPPEDLLGAADAFSATMRDDFDTWGPVASTAVAFSPVVDGETLPETPWRAVAAGAARDIDLIAGFNRDEYRLFMVMGGLFGKITGERLAVTAEAIAPAGAAAAYRSAHPGAGADDLYALICSDWLFRMPSAHLATAQAEAGGTAFAYELTWPSPAMDGALGACHGLDVPLTFGNLDAGIAALAIGSPPPEEAAALSERIRRAWTAFAATGDPGWPTHGPDPETATTHVLDVAPHDVTGAESFSRRLWAAHRFDPLD
ncbi:carboxylesterase/lipase family protein [Actinomadura rugatobispora]|uniref:Carboxylic ester hydrolase n=1 Tax=Actinomadura rugatobispora TaxID=1994 RepID=A0ABW0ZUJ3_9ACTN|nr:carboxylesterase family protein [Actinomadura rugatobispora]